MATAGVICEFNPLHGGHAYLLSRMREIAGDEGCVICAMSGHFVQRGEVAVADPYLRAEAALRCGADLVVELPFPWSAAGAEHFALGGVRILSGLGVDTLVFGSESGELTLLEAAAREVAAPTFGASYATLCNMGMGSAAAYAEALRRAMGDRPLPEDFPASNDLLGIAYLRAIATLAAEHGKTLTPVTVRREGAGYRDEVIPARGYPSATAIRALLREAACDPDTLSVMLEGTMPPAALELLIRALQREECPPAADRLTAFYHLFYRLADGEALSRLAELGGGLAAHVVSTARETADPARFPAALATRGYTDARLRRALLFGVIGVTPTDLKAAPTYTTLLAAGPRGCAYLKTLRKGEGLPVVTKPADAPEGRQTDLRDRSHSLSAACFPTPGTAGDLLRRGPRILR